jgi:two-component system, chemotaxis family, protein-glutamate methylesterase/glutaminase
MINVLIVDDDRFVCKTVSLIINQHKNMKVVAVANDGLQAVDMVLAFKPDVVVMDIEMPKMNGIDATKKIMENFPVPILIFTSSRKKSHLIKAFNAISIGAMDIIDKPILSLGETYEGIRKEFLSRIELLSKIKVSKFKSNIISSDVLVKKDLVKELSVTDVGIVTVCCSIGGPKVLSDIFKGFVDFKFPIVIAQHINESFFDTFIEWFKNDFGINVFVISNGTKLEPGKIYFCKPDYKTKINSSLVASVSSGSKHNNIGNILLESVAKSLGDKSLNFILTGMGNDGLDGAKLIKEKGGVVIAQDKNSSVVYGMPYEVVNVGLVDKVLTPKEIKKLLYSLK